MTVAQESLRLRLLMALQRPLGFVPYRRDESLGHPKLSVPLFLWSIFIFCGEIPVLYFLYADLYKNIMGQNVGSVAFGWSMTFMQVLINFGLFGLFLRSHNLCQIETQMFGEEFSWKMFRKMTVRDVAPLGIFFAPVAFTLMLFINMGTTDYAKNIFAFFFIFYMELQYVTAGLLFTELFPFLSRMLRTSVKEASTICRSRIPPKRFSEDSKASLDAALAPLFELEQKIRFFEHMREKAASYFFFLVSFSLLSAIITLITGVFALFNDAQWKQVIIGVLPPMFICIGLTCKTGNDFTRTVDAGIADLKDLSCSTMEPGIKQQVSHLISLLTPLRSLDMDGWYTLNYNSLLQVVEIVVTYLVIMLQVGWNSLNKE